MLAPPVSLSARHGHDRRSETPVTRYALTFGGVLTRDFESFGENFRGAGGTIRVPTGPQKLPVEPGERGKGGELGGNPCGKGRKRKTPREFSLGVLR